MANVGSLKQLKHRLYKWGARKNIKQSEASRITVQTGQRQHKSAARQPRYSVRTTVQDRNGGLPKRRKAELDSIGSKGNLLPLSPV